MSRWLKRRVLYPIISLTVSNIESADQWGRYSMLGESYHIHGADEVDTDYDLTHGRIWVFRQHCIAVKHSFHLTFFSISGGATCFIWCLLLKVNVKLLEHSFRETVYRQGATFHESIVILNNLAALSVSPPMQKHFFTLFSFADTRLLQRRSTFYNSLPPSCPLAWFLQHRWLTRKGDQLVRPTREVFLEEYHQEVIRKAFI